MRRQSAATSRNVGNAIVGDEHGEQVAEFLLEAQLGVQLVENRNLLRGRYGGIDEKRAQFRAAGPGGEKICELPVDRVGRELGAGDHIGKGAGVSGNEGGHLVLPSLGRVATGNAGGKFGGVGVVGFRRKRQLLCCLLNGEIGDEFGDDGAVGFRR